MNKVVSYAQEDKGFYPTPLELAQKMISGIDFNFVQTILEPSAGKGDILRVIAQKCYVGTHYNAGHNMDVDCVEIDPHLRQILKYSFSGERKNEIISQRRTIEDNRKYNRDKGKYEEFTPQEKSRLQELRSEELTFFEKGIHIVHDDFLTYEPFKQYDLIIMNPPFADAARHLLKAISIQKNGGSIVCVLNAETIKNPCNATRVDLMKQLTKYGATVEYIKNAFSSAERETDVEIALIKISIEKPQEESDIWERLKKSENLDDFQPDVTDIDVSDYIKAAISHFHVEIKAGIELIRQYRALKPYIMNNFDETDNYRKPLLRLTDTYERSYNDVSVNDYVKSVRLKYWKELLHNPKFVGKLTSKLQEEYRERITRMADYDFSEFNIQALSAEMNTKIKSGIEDEIITMFDRLTEEHSWHPETQKNRHYYDGWATNKAHKIGKKVIIPCYGVYDSWDGKPRTYKARDTVEDIEKILNFLDGGMTADVNLWNTLERHFNQGVTRNIQLKYFKVTFYKKGTMHLVFTCPELIERFNIYAAQNKGWLPPSYGRKKYKEMNTEERAVVDSFQGEEAYNEVLAKSDYYLAPPTGNTVLMLGA